VHHQGHRVTLSTDPRSEAQTSFRNCQDLISRRTVYPTYLPTASNSRLHSYTLFAYAYSLKLHAVYKYVSAFQPIDSRAVNAIFNSNAISNSNAVFNFNAILDSNTTFNNTRMVNDNFHPFPRLPLELREGIWRLCLPYRVYEMDEVNAAMVYDVLEPEEDNIPCWLYSTSKSNVRPPFITRVCRESRRVACATGKWVSRLRWRRGTGSFGRPHEADWNTGNVIDRGFWQDASRDSVLLNWTSLYDIDFGPIMDGHPLTSLAQEAKRLNGSASFMLDAMTVDIGEGEPYDEPISDWFESIPLGKGKQEDLAALKLLPEWMVVVRVVVIHLDLGRAADSGLFGLLGDEIIQVVDATLPLASQLYELAERCEHGASAVKIAQDFTRMSANDMDVMVNRVALKVFHDHEVGKRLRPAIMFRLCTRMCNHINTLKQEQDV
jgi:hypothetical protein